MHFRLSKTRFLSGCQCRKRLWLEVHRPELADYSPKTQRFLAAGERLGEIARRLYGDGPLIPYQENLELALEQTLSLLARRQDQPIYEATFASGGVLVRSDIIRQGPGGLWLTQVKSATGVKDYHYWDAAVQAWVVENQGLPLERVAIAYVNTAFVYPGGSEYQGLLWEEEVTQAIGPYKEQVPHLVAEFLEVMRGREPDVTAGEQCFTPFPCPFQSRCVSFVQEPPADAVSRIPGLSAARRMALEQQGIFAIRDLPEGFLTGAVQEQVRLVAVHGRAELDPAAGVILRQLPYPRYYLDFETMALVVPEWPGTRPYQQLPFQWSCHVEPTPGELEHKAFLDVTGALPLRRLTEELLATVGESGPVFHYGTLEKTIVHSLAGLFPDLAASLLRLKERLTDLYSLARGHYYHPDLQGSWSLKALLPTVAPDLDYAFLEKVRDGKEAQEAYLEAIDPATTPVRRAALQEHLLTYNRLDTMALVRLVNYFQNGGA